MPENELKSIRNFTTAANVLVIVSIFIMGVPLSLLAIIFSVISWRKVKKLAERNQIDDLPLQFLRKKVGTVLALSIVIFIINLATMYFMYPYYVEMINEIMGQQTGSSLGEMLSSGSSSSGSIWG